MRKIKNIVVPAGTTNVIFNTNGDADKTKDLTYTGEYVMDDNGATSTKVTFSSDPQPTKPVVSASPASGNFTESISVTLSVNPAATIYYTTDGNAPTTSSQKYSSALTFTETTTLKAFGVTSDGTIGDVKTFTYTKSSGPGPQPQPGDNLITDYYKVNPNGQVGTNRTVNMSFNWKINRKNLQKPRSLPAKPWNVNRNTLQEGKSRAHIANLSHELRSCGFANAVHGAHGFVLREL